MSNEFACLLRRVANDQLIRQKKTFISLYLGLFSGWFLLFGFLLWKTNFDGVQVALFVSIFPMIIAIEEDHRKRRKIIDEILNRRNH